MPRLRSTHGLTAEPKEVTVVTKKRVTKETKRSQNGWDTSKLLADLQKIYVRKKDGEKAWQDERDSVKVQLVALSNRLAEHYPEPKALDRGGSGIILKVLDSRLHNQERVLKFPRPLPQDAPEFAKLLDNEIRLLAGIRFRSIVAIHEAGTVPLKKAVAGLNIVPFYVMDYVSGMNSDDFLKANAISFEEYVRILHETLRAVSHLHSHGIVHLDIKPANIRIDSSFCPVLVDLGTTKRISDAKGDTKVATTLHNAPIELKRFLTKDPKDESRAEGHVKRRQIKLIWDLHYLGSTLEAWSRAVLKKNPQSMSTLQRKYLSLMALRLFQDPYENVDLDQYGLPAVLLQEFRYKYIGSVLEDIEKILPGNDLSAVIPEFDQNFHKTLQAGTSYSITATDRLAATVSHPFIRRLAEVSQLGIVQLVYPTSTHTRLEHTLGTYHNVVRYIRALYYDSLNPLFRQLMDPVHLRAALLAALLHDIGQFPMAHDFEDVDEEMFSHAVLVTALIKGTREEKLKGTTKMIFPSLDEVFELWKVKKQDVLSILEAKINNPSHSIRSRILKSLISGPIDADKLDYLIRDSIRLNVPYPMGIDAERLLQCLTLVVKESGNGVLAYVVVHEKGRVPAEFLILARYAMYAQVYWHHSVRAAKGMLSRAVRSLINALDTELKRNRFRSNFERFVLFELGYEKRGGVTQLSFFKADAAAPKVAAEKAAFEGKFSGTPLNSWDISTLVYIRNVMASENLPESELIDGILERKLYKRAFIFDANRDEHVWKGLVNQWDRMNSGERVASERKIEKALISAIGKKLEENPDTAYLTEEQTKSIEMRIAAELPLLIVDVPSHKPGSRKSLEYVVEEGRRELRKSDRICGLVQEDGVWSEYAERLRENAGRIRVFVHKQHVDTVLSAVDRAWMGQILEDLSALDEAAKP